MLDFSQIIDLIKRKFNVTADSDVATLLELSGTALYNHKSRGSIPFKNILSFCERKNVSLDWLLTGKEPEKQLKPPEEKSLPPKLQILFEMASNLPDSVQNKMLETVLKLKREDEEAKQQRGAGKKANGAQGKGAA